MPETMTEFEERVARGAALLDKYDTDWVDRIGLETFDLADPCNCTLGQLFGWYSAGVHYFGFTAESHSAYLIQNSAHNHGFFENALEDELVGDARRLGRWQELERAWVELIQERKAAA